MSIRNPSDLKGALVSECMHTFKALQLVVLVSVAVSLWFAAATTVRLGSGYGFFGQFASLITFAVAVPVCWLSVWLTIRLARLTPNQIVPGISLGLGVATLLDGLAITWASKLYGTHPQQISLGAAWILFGVGLFIASAFVETYRQRS
jgi:hypothetical protein